MKFSILIAHYNNARYFKQCFDSLVAQTYTNWEAIILDDGSKEDEKNIALLFGRPLVKGTGGIAKPIEWLFYNLL